MAKEKMESSAESEAGYSGSKGKDPQRSEMGVGKSKLDKDLGEYGGKNGAQYKDAENIKKQGMGE